ncbi:MAG: transposase [Corallincola sp.]|nr:transposase [Corallincola sp.]
MKFTRGLSIEITDLLSEQAAMLFARWIGGATVIYNQKTRDNRQRYDDWVSAGRPEAERQFVSQETAYLQQRLPFLSELPAQIRRNAGSHWFSAWNGFTKGLRDAPKTRSKHQRRTALVTNELFFVQPLGDSQCVLHIRASAKKSDRGALVFGLQLPVPAASVANSLFLSRQGRRFWLSIGYDIERDVPTEAEIWEQLRAMTAQELSAVVTGYDVGVINQVMDSDGNRFHFSPDEQRVLARREQLKRKYQRRYARAAAANGRQGNPAKGRAPTRTERHWLGKAATESARMANIRCNRSHHISRAIAEQTPVVAVFEAINHQNLAKAPKAKKCPETGNWLRNGRAAKRGLNRALASVNLGQIRQFSGYKLRERGKLLVQVPQQYSSQTCSECGCQHADNRKSQSLFVCTACGFTCHADENAGRVLKQRGLSLICSSTLPTRKAPRKTSIRRKSAPEPASLDGGGRVRPLGAVADDAIHGQFERCAARTAPLETMPLITA